MVTRRIATGVCALCFAIPSAAVASAGTNPPIAQGPYGISDVNGAPIAAEAKGPYGPTLVTGAPILAKAKGPYGIAPATGTPIFAKAKGPYGVTPVNGPPITAGATVHPAAVTRSDSTTAWRIAAICEAALLAAVALGLHLVRRAPRLVT